MQSSVLVDMNDDSMGELQQLLFDSASIMKRVNFARSNVSGRLFYKGCEFPVADPVGEHVTVESLGADGKAVVRDDDPPPSFANGATVYHYVKTVYAEESNKFLRYYVMLDWLKSMMEVDMTGTTLSGYGLTSLVAATASKLEVLRVAHCSALDNRGLYAITTLCTQLRVLDISACPKVTSHGACLFVVLSRVLVLILRIVMQASCIWPSCRCST